MTARAPVAQKQSSWLNEIFLQCSESVEKFKILTFNQINLNMESQILVTALWCDLDWQLEIEGRLVLTNNISCLTDSVQCTFILILYETLIKIQGVFFHPRPPSPPLFTVKKISRGQSFQIDYVVILYCCDSQSRRAGSPLVANH